MQQIGFMNHKPAQKISLSNVSAVIGAGMAQRTVMIWANVDCFYVKGGASAVATADVPSIPIPAYTPIYVDMGDFSNTHIAAIVASGTGTLYVVPCE